VTTHEVDMFSSSLLHMPSSCDSVEMSSYSLPPKVLAINFGGKQEELQRDPDKVASSASQLNGEAVVSVDFSDYQTGPDSLQFTLIPPK